MFLFVGLGNLGKKYFDTRHNVGFFVIDELIKKFNFDSLGKKYSSSLFKGKIGNDIVMAIKPQTMMNNSGTAVKKIKDFYKIPINRVFVFYDEIDLVFLKLKIKIGGNSAGHNGIKSIDKLIGKNYNRIRIGIGKPLRKNMVSSFVLSSFTETEMPALKEKIHLMITYFDTLLEYKFDLFLNKLSKREVII